MAHIETKIQTEITPEFMAACFCEMDNIEQARFFSSITKTAKVEWLYYNTQISYICDVLDEDGKEFIFQLADNIKRE